VPYLWDWEGCYGKLAIPKYLKDGAAGLDPSNKEPMVNRKTSFNETTRTYSPIDGPCEHRLEIPVSEGGDILFWRCQCGLKREKAPSKQRTEQRK
jgi:hypothetical protein